MKKQSTEINKQYKFVCTYIIYVTKCIYFQTNVMNGHISLLSRRNPS